MTELVHVSNETMDCLNAIQEMSDFKKKLHELVDTWNIRRLPKLPDGSLHPMDHVQQNCAKQLEKILTSE